MAFSFRHVEMVGSDNRMDQKGNFSIPVNPLPVKCSHCTFPDLDFVPQPYLLAKGTSNPNELDPAEIGNFFVRDRTRKILEAVVPDQCLFYATYNAKTKKETDWFLAVPTTIIRTATVKKEIPRCPKCSEPKVAHPGSHYEYPEVPLAERIAAMAESAGCNAGSVSSDLFKSLNWSSSESIGEVSRWYTMHILGWKKKEQVPPNQWTRVVLGRELFFSIRLDALLMKLGIKGLYRAQGYNEKVNAEEVDWVERKHQQLIEQGLAAKPTVTLSPALDKWFRSYLKKNATKDSAIPDFAAIEGLHGVSLPPSYQDFITTVGEMTYRDVDEAEGYAVTILSTDKVDFQQFRKGNTDFEDEESRAVDGVMFATCENGDCFCFDASAGPECPVYLFNHEGFFFEAYTQGFKECLQRFARK